MKIFSLLACIPAVVATTTCFYNLAYEEKNYIDEPNYTLRTAKDCYILLDESDFDDATQFVKYANDLKINNNTIGCYMSVGTIEDWRSDFKQFVKGTDYQSKQWAEWKGEYFIKAGSNGYPTDNTVALMKKRIDDFANWGCEYIEMDNMDLDENQKATDITGDNMRKYNQDLCNYMHTSGVKCMAKNSGPSDADDDLFDGLSVESYTDEKNWWGQDHANKFTSAGKPFMISHYDESTIDDCLGIWNYYKGLYNSTFGLVCSQYETKHYIHFGFKI